MNKIALVLSRPLLGLPVLLALLLLPSCMTPNKPTKDKDTITLQTNTIHLEVGETQPLHFTLADESQRSKVTFTSSNPSVASVTAKGDVTGVSTGICEIELKLNDSTAKAIIEVTERSKNGRLQFAIYSSGMPSDDNVTFDLIEGGEYSLEYFKMTNIVAVYDGQYVSSTDAVWENLSTDLLYTILDGVIYACEVTAKPKEGTGTIRVTYKGESATLRIKTSAPSKSLMTELPTPKVRWGATANEVNAWELAHGGTLKPSGNQSEIVEYTVANDAYTIQRAYRFANPDGTLSEVFIAAKPTEYVYNTSDDEMGGIYYMPKDEFLALLKINNVQGIQASTNGNGQMICVMIDDPNGTEGMGIKIYPDFSTITSPDEVAKNVVLEYKQIKK